MLFSILVPVYQAEQYFPECLRSIEDQICQDFEVVLVDDGSTDASAAMCDAFAQKYPGRVTVIHKENQGLISARRTGIAAAQGRYAVFLDSDDMLDAYCLKILKEKLETYDYPEMIIYQYLKYCDGRLSPSELPDLGRDVLYIGDGKQVLYRGILERTTPNCLWVKAIRTELLKNDPIDYCKYYDQNMAEDLLQTLYPLTCAERVLCTNEPLYYYRNNPNGMMKKCGIETLHKRNRMHVYRKIQEYLPLWGLDTLEARDKLHGRWIYTIVEDMVSLCLMQSSKDAQEGILRFPWHEFLDTEREVPDCLDAHTARLWQLYTEHNFSKLYQEILE